MTTPAPQPDLDVVDFDGAWKEALDLYFEDALKLLTPAIAAQIDWAAGVTALDKELQKATPARDRKARTADKLVRVRLLAGHETWVLIHVEVQSQQEQSFSRRMFNYNARLHERYERSVNSLAILGDERVSWRPTQYRYGEFSDTGIVFPIVKLAELDRAALEASDNPFVMVVLAHIAAQATRNQPLRRADVKVALARRMVEKGFSREQFDSYLALVDWLMQLPPHVEEPTNSTIKEIREEEYAMRPVNPIERMYRTEGVRSIITHILESKFGSVPDDVVAQLNIANSARLESISLDIALAQTLDEVRALLPKVGV